MKTLSIFIFLFLFALTQCVSQNAVVNCVKKQMDKPYVWGAIGPNSYDCSGLAYYCHNQAIPRVASDQAAGNGRTISKNSVAPGDLMFWNTSGNGVSHTTVCIGNGYMIHASSSAGKVIKTMYKGNTYWEPRFVTAKRYWS